MFASCVSVEDHMELLSTMSVTISEPGAFLEVKQKWELEGFNGYAAKMSNG